MRATAEIFERTLERIFSKSEELGLVAIEVKSGNLHRIIGGYPGQDHRMPMCCDAMYRKMKETDSILSRPESGKGATVIVRYLLPR